MNLSEPWGHQLGYCFLPTPVETLPRHFLVQACPGSNSFPRVIFKPPRGGGLCCQRLGDGQRPNDVGVAVIVGGAVDLCRRQAPMVPPEI